MEPPPQVVALSRTTGPQSGELTIGTLLMLIPSEDGTAAGTSKYGIWSGLARRYKRYSPRYSSSLEIQGSSPEHTEDLLSLLAEDYKMPEQMKKIVIKVDAFQEESFLQSLREGMSRGKVHLWEGEKVTKFIEKCSIDEAKQRQLYNALVRGILLTVPYHCVQSNEMVAEMIEELTNPTKIVNQINLRSTNVAHIHDDVLHKFQVRVGKVSKYGVDGLQQGSSGGRRAFKALNHAKMVLVNYRPNGRTKAGDKEEEKSKVAAEKLERIMHHAEGGFVEGAWQRKLLARGYVLVSFVISVLTGVLNWARRDNYYERVSDFVQTLTVLWVSIFGLIKLTSEDENAIRNTLLGKKILRTSEDVRKYAGCADDLQLKRAMMRSRRLQWLDPTECCYVNVPTPGTIKVLGGVPVEECLKTGMLLLGDRIFQNEDAEEGHILNVTEDGMHHFDRTSMGKMQSNYQVITETGFVA